MGALTIVSTVIAIFSAVSIVFQFLVIDYLTLFYLPADKDSWGSARDKGMNAAINRRFAATNSWITRAGSKLPMW
jgi:hypothetical protein